MNTQAAIADLRVLALHACDKAREHALAMHTAKGFGEVHAHGYKMHLLLVRVREIAAEFPELEPELREKIEALAKPMPECAHCQAAQAEQPEQAQK